MKKVLLIFTVLSLLIFIRPALGLNTNVTGNIQAETTELLDDSEQESLLNNALNGIKIFYSYTGFANATSGNLLMIFIGIVFIYLGIKFDYEPLLLIPIGTGVIIGNIPLLWQEIKPVFMKRVQY